MRAPAMLALRLRTVPALALALALLELLAPTGPALGHASLVRSEPADRAVVARSPDVVTLTFNEPVTPVALRLVGADGHTIALTDIRSVDATVIARLPEALLQGTHVLSWRVFSADGHPVGGTLAFSVGEPSAAPARPQPNTDPMLRAAIWLARVVLLVGLLIGAGGTIYAGWIARSPPAAPRMLASILSIALIAAIVSVGLQGLDVLGAPLSHPWLPQSWTSGLATAYGATACIAIAVLVLALLAIRGVPRVGAGISALTLVGIGAALAVSGHAGTAQPQWLTRPAVFVHVVAVALWVGALLPLVAAMRSPQRRGIELMRFSRPMPAVVVLLLVSGTVLAIVQVRTITALWTTDYGLVLCAKLALVLLLLTIAATNRYLLTPRVAAGESSAARKLGRNAVIECAIVLGVLALVATWRFTPPPRALLAAAQAPLRVHIHSNQAMADIEIEPPQGGSRHIIVSVLDGQFGPLTAKEVTLFLAKPEAGIERLRLPATHVEGAIWQVEGPHIGLFGRWQARLEILINDFEKVALEDEIDFSR
jgi:copper transport protein